MWLVSRIARRGGETSSRADGAPGRTAEPSAEEVLRAFAEGGLGATSAARVRPARPAVVDERRRRRRRP